MALPLANRITHKPVYISSSDDAWDHGRIEKEQGAILAGEETPWPELDDHPIMRYRTGDSRFDLATVSEYLIPGKSPVRFHIRRLSIKEWDSAQALLGFGEGNGPARLLAIQQGLESVDGLPEWQAHRKRHGWDVEDVEALRDLIGDIEYQALGYAVLFASRPLDPREKKL